MPAVPAVPAVPGFAAEQFAQQLAEPIRWTFRQGGDMWEEPLRTGPVTFLGVSATPPPRELAAHLPIPEDTGLVVEGIVPDSPAAKAGLQQSDVLTKLDDQILIHPRQLSVLVANHKEGETVKLSYIRKGEAKEAAVVLGEREHKPPVALSGHGDPNREEVIIAGDHKAPLRTFVRRFNLPEGGPGGSVQVDPAGKVMGKVRAEIHELTEAAAERDETKRELDELRRKLDEVLKRLEERK
jgi:membrane-associated protease RseP (regulator of RpoE activity)